MKRMMGVVTVALVAATLLTKSALAWNDGTDPGTIPYWCTTLEEIAKYLLFCMW